ncbi:DUF3596 domain-containing protein [Mycoavidus sp. HKI]|uniref:Arm DNA-binding domain-containing protein n=1 Tax=Mycoavidus sp. HKI TaxID=2840467 RepID=UPI001CBD9BA9|nr:DUF3596 domain-containing protein [Mycoavidus sp. HKI]UAW63462.1 DUF3596 domain-containing protein [Mycoavidus sp. HKI]
MGRKGTGVEIHGNAIRLSFTFDGKRERKLLMLNDQPMQPTSANMKYAHRIAQEIRERIRHGTFNMAEYFPTSGADGVFTLKGWFDTWLDTQNIKKSTKAGYKNGINFWNRAIAYKEKQMPLGTLTLCKLKLSHLLTAIAQRPDLSGKTINNYVSVIRQALDLAVSDKIISKNPAQEVPRAKHQKPQPDPFSRDEAEAIIADMGKHYPEQIYNMVEAWFFTGLRTSEVAGQRWPNVDLYNKKLTVAEVIVLDEEKSSTKTNVARDVILNSRALGAINRQAKHTRITGKHVWRVHDKPWMDKDWEGFRLNHWTPCLKRLGIRYRRPYNMRHSYATMMLMAGMTPAFCARQLGHSIEMFLHTYAKWLDGAQNDLEMARFESSLGENLPQICPRKSSLGF